MHFEDLLEECFLLRGCGDLILISEVVVCLREWVILAWMVLTEWTVLPGLLRLDIEVILLLGEVPDLGVILPEEGTEAVVVITTEEAIMTKVQILLAAHPEETTASEEAVTILLEDCHEETIVVEAVARAEEEELIQLELSCTVPAHLRRESNGHSKRFKDTKKIKTNQLQKDRPRGRLKAVTTLAGSRQEGWRWVNNTAT